MKRNNKLLKLLTMFCAFAMGTSVIVTLLQNKTPTRVEAAQHMDNYALYSYSGSYYNSFNFNATGGLNGALRENLTELIYPKGWYTYSGQGEEYLATQLQYADEDPTNSNNMIYLYSRDSVAKNPASSWNREHCWPQSLSNGCWGESKAGADILHIRPTYDANNSSRGNDKYCDVNKASPRTMKNSGMLFGYGDGTSFEPLDAVKGDVARIIMYTWTAYNNYYSNIPAITNVFESYDTLLKWHTKDKPDVLEGNRNNYSETSKQKNRNPFVDHPELAWKIFGDQASTSIKNACMEAYPAEGYVPPSGDTLTGVSLNKTSLSLGVNQTETLVASPIPSTANLGTVTWSSSNTSIATVTTSGVVKGIVAGSATITARVSSSIYAQCNVTVTSSSSSEEDSLTIDFTDKSYSVSAPSQAQTTLSTTTVGGYSFNLLNAHNNAKGYTYMMFATKNLSTSNSLVSNKTVVPGPITKIVFNTTTTASTNAVYKATLSSSEIISPVTSSTYSLTGKGSITITADASDNLRYFGISCSTSSYNGQLKDIEITYSTEQVIPVEPTAREVVEELPTKASLTYNYTKEEGDAISDVLDNSFTGIGDVTNYTSWSNKTGTSGAVYAGLSAGSYSSIQLRTKNSNEGVVVTSNNSGKDAQSVTIRWNTNTTSGRSVEVYGNNIAYSSPSALFGNNKGTLIGTMAYNNRDENNETTINISASYKFIGIKSGDSALYLDSITINWGSATTFSYSGVGIRFSGFMSTDQWDLLNDESPILSYGVIFAYDGRNIKNAYNSNKTNENTVDEAISATCDGSTVIYLNTQLSETKTSPKQDGDNYFWNLFKKVPIENIKTEFSAIAYLRIENDIIFLQEVKASATGLAQQMLDSGEYDNASYEGSLYNLANL